MLEEWCDEIGGRHTDLPDQESCTLDDRKIVVKNDGEVDLWGDENWRLEGIEDMTNEGESLFLESDSGVMRITENDQEMQVRRFVHVTSEDNIDSICSEGLQSDQTATVDSRQAHETLPEAIEAIDRRCPDQAPLRRESNFLAFPVLGHDPHPEGIEGEEIRLHIDPDQIPEDCQCVIDRVDSEVDICRAVRDESPVDLETELSFFWDDAEVGSIEEMKDRIVRRGRSADRSPEIYCGCDIPPEAIDEC